MSEPPGDGLPVDQVPAVDVPPAAPADEAFAVGTYAVYGGPGGGLVLVLQDARTGEVSRHSAPGRVIRLLQAMVRRGGGTVEFLGRLGGGPGGVE
jgi:hypothetical protein